MTNGQLDVTLVILRQCKPKDNNQCIKPISNDNQWSARYQKMTSVFMSTLSYNILYK